MTNLATCNSCGVSWSVAPPATRRRTVWPLARSSPRARSVHSVAPSMQPVDPAVVAARLAAAADRPPAGRLPDLGGPDVLSFAAMARSYLRAVGRLGRRRVAEIPVPGRFSAAMRAGGNLAPGNRAGPTWHQFLIATRPRHDHPSRTGSAS